MAIVYGILGGIIGIGLGVLIMLKVAAMSVGVPLFRKPKTVR